MIAYVSVELASMEEYHPIGNSGQFKRSSETGVQEIHVGANYTEDEIEFIKAIDAYQRANHKRFLAFTEVLAIAKSLGYRKVVDPPSATSLADEVFRRVHDPLSGST